LKHASIAPTVVVVDVAAEEETVVETVEATELVVEHAVAVAPGVDARPTPLLSTSTTKPPSLPCPESYFALSPDPRKIKHNRHPLSHIF
jgi:hypothetical protein